MNMTLGKSKHGGQADRKGHVGDGGQGSYKGY